MFCKHFTAPVHFSVHRNSKMFAKYGDPTSNIISSEKNVPLKVVTILTHLSQPFSSQLFSDYFFFTNSFKTRLICRKKELLNPGLTVMDNFGGVIFQQCCNHVMSISQHAKLSLLKSQAKAR